MRSIEMLLPDSSGKLKPADPAPDGTRPSFVGINKSADYKEKTGKALRFSLDNRQSAIVNLF